MMRSCTHARPAGAAVVAACLVALAGCATPVPHNPAPERYQFLDTGEVQRRMAELVMRSRDPQVGGIQFGADFFEYRFLNSSVAQQVYYANIDWLQLWDNHYVYIYGPGNQFLAKFLLWTHPEAMDLIDMIHLLRARQRGLLPVVPPELLPPPAPLPGGQPLPPGH